MLVFPNRDMANLMGLARGKLETNPLTQQLPKRCVEVCQDLCGRLDLWGGLLACACAVPSLTLCHTLASPEKEEIGRPTVASSSTTHRAAGTDRARGMPGEDDALQLLKRARALLEARAAADKTAPASSALHAVLLHVDQSIAHLALTHRDIIETAAEAPAEPVVIQANKCSQETQTFSRQSASTASQASPIVASASTGTGPQQVGGVFARRQLQENRAV